MDKKLKSASRSSGRVPIIIKSASTGNIFHKLDKKKSASRSLGKDPMMKSASTGNISHKMEKRLDNVECSLKKLELNLRLVDGDDIDEEEFTKLKNEIEVKCNNDIKNTKKFLNEMINKKDNNSLKKIVKYLIFIGPVLSTITQTVIPYIVEKELSPEIIKSFLNTYQTYIEHVSKIFQTILQGGNDTVDLFDKGMEAEFFSVPNNLTTKITTISDNALTLANDIINIQGNILVKLPTILKYVSNVCSSLNIHGVASNVSRKLLKKYNLLYFTFCLSMFYILLYSKVKFRADKNSNIFHMFNTTNVTNLLMHGNGKKVKKSKSSKPKKNPKKII